MDTSSSRNVPSTQICAHPFPAVFLPPSPSPLPSSAPPPAPAPPSPSSPPAPSFRGPRAQCSVWPAVRQQVKRLGRSSSSPSPCLLLLPRPLARAELPSSPLPRRGGLSHLRAEEADTAPHFVAQHIPGLAAQALRWRVAHAHARPAPAPLSRPTWSAPSAEVLAWVRERRVRAHERAREAGNVKDRACEAEHDRRSERAHTRERGGGKQKTQSRGEDSKNLAVSC